MSDAVRMGDDKSAEKEKFSFSKETDGVKKTVRGEEVENGWIVTVEKSWEEKNPANGYTDYKNNEWRYISPKDPREIINDQQQVKKPTIDTTAATDMLKSISDSQNLLIVT
jgi:hypothetical protein